MPLPDKFNISGTPEQLAVVLPILEAMYLGFKDIKTEGGGTTNRMPIDPDFDDWLQITVHWIGYTVDTKKEHRIEKSVRLKSIDPKTVSIETLQTLARRVATKFKGLPFKSGHCKVKYAKFKDGISTWGYFENKEIGYKIIESLGDIISKPIDKKRLRHEYVDDTSTFDPTPSKIPLAGKLVRPPARAPIASMKFNRATILFPWIGHVEKLCDPHGYIIPNLDFLKAYED